MPWIIVIAIVYGAGFALFYPEVFVSTDESIYVEQASAFASGLGVSTPVSTYPPGTSLVQTAFVAAGGWQAAAWVSVLALAATALMLARWLKEAGLPPAGALVFLGYAPTLVLGRVGMSDVPSAAIVTAALWLMWTGEKPASRVCAGVLAAVSLLFRETNGIIFVPFIAAAIWQRRVGWKGLVAGVCAGTIGVLGVNQWISGAPMPLRETAGWSMTAPFDAGPMYALALMALIPGGLAAVCLYRGKHYRETILAVVLYVGTYLFYDYSGQGSEGWARLATAGRYLIPIVPLVAIAWTDVAHRRFPALLAPALQRIATPLVLVAAAAVHPVMSAWSERDVAVVRDVLTATEPGSVLVTSPAERKFVSPVYGRTRVWIDEGLPAVAARAERGPTYLVAVQRSETQAMAALSDESHGYIARTREACDLELAYERDYPGSRHLQMWKIRSCPY